MSNCMSGGLAAASARCGMTARDSAASSVPTATASTPACFKAERRVMSAGEATVHLSFALAIQPGEPEFSTSGPILATLPFQVNRLRPGVPHRNLMLTAG